MNLKDKLKQSINHFAEVFSRQAEATRISREQIDAVYRPLSELMAEFAEEFSDLKLVKSPGGLLFCVDTMSTLAKSSLVFDTESHSFLRHDELDLNLSEVIFKMADSNREDSIEEHDFVYDSAEEVIEEYVKWIGWAVALLRHERANPES